MNSAVNIAVIPQGSTHRYWKAIHAGALKAEGELNEQGLSVRVSWKGPIREDDSSEQMQIVERFLAKGVQGLVLAPFDGRTLVRPVEEAARGGVPTVVIDSPLETTKIVSVIATDNRRAGALAADRLGEVLYGKGKVMLVRYQRGSASTQAREEGFVERLRQRYPGMELISSDHYAGATRDSAKRAAEALLARHGKEATGVFTPNESSTTGMLLALQGARDAGRIAFVGFDSSDTIIEGLRHKQIQGLVVQDPFRMGELGVKMLFDHLCGKAVQKSVDTGATMIAPENVDASVAQRLLHPPTAD